MIRVVNQFILMCVMLFLTGAPALAGRHSNVCSPITDEGGRWSKFEYSTDNFLIRFMSAIDGLDDSNGSRLYYISTDYLLENVPDLVSIIGPAQTPHGIEMHARARANGRPYEENSEYLMGVVSPYSRDKQNLREESMANTIIYLQIMSMPRDEVEIIEDRGLWWVNPNGEQHPHYIMFSKPFRFKHKDWASYKGTCPFLREKVRPLRDENKYLHAQCELNFFWKDMEISYDIRADRIEDYPRVEEFIKTHVLCERAK